MYAESGRSASRASTGGSESWGMLEINQAKQLKELQRENARLKRMLADETLGKELLKEVLEKKL